MDQSAATRARTQLELHCMYAVVVLVLCVILYSYVAHDRARSLLSKKVESAVPRFPPSRRGLARVFADDENY